MTRKLSNPNQVKNNLPVLPDTFAWSFAVRRQVDSVHSPRDTERGRCHVRGALRSTSHTSMMQGVSSDDPLHCYVVDDVSEAVHAAAFPSALPTASIENYGDGLCEPSITTQQISNASALLTFFAASGAAQSQASPTAIHPRLDAQSLRAGANLSQGHMHKVPRSLSVGGEPPRTWNAEVHGLSETEPWSLLPREVRPKAKLPGFLRAGWLVLEQLRRHGLAEFEFLVQV